MPTLSPQADTPEPRILAWGIAFDGFRPNRYSIVGALICLIVAEVIMLTLRVLRGVSVPTYGRPPASTAVATPSAEAGSTQSSIGCNASRC